ncbi:Hypothetical protein NTJ_11873 [Nesidiocoris tenuis]|uniref:Uncharacterized protein n=1 Tax=Nesidiocoris tenuis TaxID=355587 RepID=A0ABN7B3S7_9HEMI|nr:Hypothetical protein NTJ_11873 [Nesidiocoris tenuis]
MSPNIDFLEFLAYNAVLPGVPRRPKNPPVRRVFLEELKKQLLPFPPGGPLKTWADGEVPPGLVPSGFQGPGRRKASLFYYLFFPSTFVEGSNP